MSKTRFKERNDHDDPWSSPKQDSLRMTPVSARQWSSPKLTFHVAVEEAVAAIERDSSILWIAYAEQKHYLVRSLLNPPMFLIALQLLLVISYFIGCLIWGVDEWRTSYFQQPGKGRGSALSLYQLVYFRFLNSSWPTALIVNRITHVIYSVGSSSTSSNDHDDNDEKNKNNEGNQKNKRRNSSSSNNNGNNENNHGDEATTFAAKVFDISDDKNKGKVAPELLYTNSQQQKPELQQHLLGGNTNDDGEIRNDDDDGQQKRRGSDYARGSVHIPEEKSAAAADVATKIERKSQARLQSQNNQLSLKQHIREVLLELFRDVYFLVPVLLLTPPFITHCIPSIIIFIPVFLFLVLLLIIMILFVRRVVPSVPFDPDTHLPILSHGSGLFAVVSMLLARALLFGVVCLLFRSSFNYSLLWSGLYGENDWKDAIWIEWNAQSLKCLFFTLEGEPINALQHFGSLFA